MMTEKLKIFLKNLEAFLQQRFIFVYNFCFKNTAFSLLTGLVIAGVFSAMVFVLAAPRTNLFNIGETDNPTCSPGDDFCDVIPPAGYTFGTNNFSGTGDFTTTGIVTAGTLKIGTAMTFPTTDGSLNQVLKTTGAGVLSWATVDALPTQTGNNGKYLTTDGSSASWATIDLSGYVPYTGATGDFNLGAHNFSSTGSISAGTTNKYGAITASGGTSFTAIPGYGVASIGTIYNTSSSWQGNGFLFTNSSLGTKAFSMVYNADKAWFGALADSSTDLFGTWDANGLTIGSSGANVNKLDVQGGMAIGSYAGVNSAPSNGLIVSGNVGVGTTSPGYKLDVNGDVNIASGSKFKINGNNLTYSDVGAQVAGSYLSLVAGTNLDNVWSSTGILTRTGTGTYSTTANNSTNWDTAYGWGNHAGLYYKSGDAVTFANITNSGLTSGRVTYATTVGLLTDSAGLTYDGTTLKSLAAGGAQLRTAYDASNYANSTVDSAGNLTIATATGSTGGDIILSPAGSGSPTFLSDTGYLVFGGNNNTNNEDLKFDFETTSNAISLSSSTGATVLDTGALSLGINNPNATAKLDIASASTTGNDFLLTNSGISTSGSVATITANSLTTGDVLTLNATGMTTGSLILGTGPNSTGVTDNFVSFTSDVGSAASLIYGAPDFSGAGVTAYGSRINATDSTASTNTDYTNYGSLALTGNAAKIGYGTYNSVTSTSTTADTTYGGYFNTAVSGAVASGTQNTYGVYGRATASNTAGGTANVYGGYFKADGTVASGSVNSYGLYVANGTMNTTGTSTNYGLYVEAPTGADNNYSAIFAGGNVGIGVAVPNARLDVLATSGAQQRLSYDTSNYANFTVASNGDLTVLTATGTTGGDIVFSPASAGNPAFLSGSGTVVFGGTGNTNNEDLSFDFETNANSVALGSSTGVTDISWPGTLTLGGSTAGTLVTRISAGAPTEADANGSLVVDSTNFRLYFRYSDTWHYMAQTAGFQIPNFEVKDTITNEDIVEKDFVVGQVNQTLEDGALHGVWVKYSSVIKQITGQLPVLNEDGTTADGKVADIDMTNYFVVGIKNVLAALGINAGDKKGQIKTIRIEKMEMVDSGTGEIYCTWIENGEWIKVKGDCNENNQSPNQNPESSPIIPPTEVLGCTNSEATNYNKDANKDDGSCTLPETPATPPLVETPIIPPVDPVTPENPPVETPAEVQGCTNSEATNYNAGANKDDGSCVMPTSDEATPEVPVTEPPPAEIPPVETPPAQ